MRRKIRNIFAILVVLIFSNNTAFASTVEVTSLSDIPMKLSQEMPDREQEY